MKSGLSKLTLTRINFSTQIETFAGYRYWTSLSEPFPNMYEITNKCTALWRPSAGLVEHVVVAVHTLLRQRVSARACVRAVLTRDVPATARSRRPQSSRVSDGKARILFNSHEVASSVPQSAVTFNVCTVC